MGLRRLKTGKCWERGQTMTEFGLMAPIFALLLFGSVQLMLLPYQRAMMEKAVWAASRAAVTATSTASGEIEAKVEKAVAPYRRMGFMGNDMTVYLSNLSGARRVTLTIPNRLFYNLGGVKLGDSAMMSVSGQSLVNYEGPLPEAEVES